MTTLPSCSGMWLTHGQDERWKGCKLSEIPNIDRVTDWPHELPQIRQKCVTIHKLIHLDVWRIKRWVILIFTHLKMKETKPYFYVQYKLQWTCTRRLTIWLRSIVRQWVNAKECNGIGPLKNEINKIIKKENFRRSCSTSRILDWVAQTSIKY